MTADDKERYLSAIATLYDTPADEGRERYGSDYKAAKWFIEWYRGRRVNQSGQRRRREVSRGDAAAATWTIRDKSDAAAGTRQPSVETSARLRHLGKTGVVGKESPWHAAPSFWTAHASFTLEFEKSLQSIDATVAAHYFDWTAGAADWKHEPVLADEDWFGPLWQEETGDDSALQEETGDDSALPADAGRVRGRFSHVEVPYNRSFPSHNAFGQNTLTYNGANNKFLTRAASICGLPTTSMALPDCTALLGAWTSLDGSYFYRVDIADGLRRGRGRDVSFHGEESRRRRGRDVDILRRRGRGGAAAAT